MRIPHLACLYALLAMSALAQLSPTSVLTGQIPTFSRPSFIPAAGCNGTTAAPAFDLPSANAPTAACAGTSYRFGTLDFADSANSTATAHYTLPGGLTSLDVSLLWTSASATQAVKWTLATVCLAAGSDVLNPTFNASQTISSTSSGTANTQTIATQTGVTITGCAPGNEMILQVGRDVTDTSTVAASLRGLSITPHAIPQP